MDAHNDVESKLSAVSEDFSSNCAEIRREVASWQKQIEALEKEDRDLTIAIVGRVKSGKSSLLNALFFEGRSVLPQAATPMTAALTFLKYDDHYHAEVEYFTKKEWEGFEELAKNYREKFDKKRQELVEREEKRCKKEKSELGRCGRREITDEFVRDQLKGETSDEELAAVELVTAAAKIGPQLLDKLGTTERVEIGDMEGENAERALMGRLQKYVGAGGANTPIVCSSTIYFPKLKGYCIIDTPGMNDPVVSRGMRTMEKLKKADVAIVVSPASSFFDQQDLDFCSQKLSDGRDRAKSRTRATGSLASASSARNIASPQTIVHRHRCGQRSIGDNGFCSCKSRWCIGSRSCERRAGCRVAA